MMNIFSIKAIIFFSLIIFSSTLFFAQPVTFYNNKTELYGIKDQKTGKILTLAKYRRIEQVTKYDEGSSLIKFFIAFDAKKAYLIGAEGIRFVSEPYDSFSSIDVNAGSFFINSGGKDAILIVGKGVNDEIGWFSRRRSLIYGQEIYKVEKDGKVFFLDAKKQILSKEHFEDILEGEFYVSDSSKVFLVKKGKWGMYGMEKKQFIPCGYDTILTKDDIFLKKNGRWGIADKSGKIKQECLYESIDPVYEKIYSSLFNSDLYPVKQNGKYGILGPGGNWVIKNEYDSLVKVKFGSLFYFMKNKKMGIVDKSGKEVAAFAHDHIERSDENFLNEQKIFFYLVYDRVNSDVKDAGVKWGTLDVSGKILQAVNANCVPLLSYYRFTTAENEEKFSGMWDSSLVGFLWNIGGIEQDLNLPVDCTWTEVADAEGNWFNQKVAYYRLAITISGGKTGIMGRDGKFLIEPLYEETELPFDKFRGMDDRDLLVKGNIKYAEKIPQKSQEEYGIKPKYPIIFKLNGKWGAKDLSGKEVMPFVYDSIFYDQSPCYFDASDSAYNARGYQRDVLRGYKGNKYGYTYLDGKEKCPPVLQRSYRHFSLMNTDSLIKNPNYNPPHEQLELVQIEVTDTKIRQLEVWKMDHEQFDEMGNTFSKPVKFDFEEMEGGKITLFDACKLSALSKEWGEGIRLISSKGPHFDPMTFKMQLLTDFGSSEIDSIVLKGTAKKVPFEFSNTQTDDYYLDHYFLKRGAKWYLYKSGDLQAINEGFGFDSVRTADNLNYIAYGGYKHAYYDLKYKGPFTNEAEVIFPDTVSKMRMMANNAILSWREYIRKDTVKRFDESGNDRPDTIVPVLFRIPHVESGKFNLLDERNNVVFKNWADQLILPKDSRGQQFSITDGNSFVYNKEHVLYSRDYSAINSAKKSVALKIGEEWFLSSASNPTFLIGKFKDIKLEGDKWVCTKKKKIVYYSVDGLKKVD
jgi:hypothetical protein